MSAPPVPSPRHLAGWLAWAMYGGFPNRTERVMTLIRAHHLAPEVAAVLADHIKAARFTLEAHHETPTPCPAHLGARVNTCRALVELGKPADRLLIGADGGAVINALLAWLDATAREVYPPRKRREYFASLAPGTLGDPGHRGETV